MRHYGTSSDQILVDTLDTLERTGSSIARSQQIALETEQIGTEVLGELSEQRESLLRSTRGLENVEEDLSKSRVIIRRIRRELIYNKIVLTLIIIMEIGILVGLLLIKFLRH